MKINNSITFSGKFYSVPQISLDPKIKNSLLYGEVTSVLEDTKGFVVKQHDGRAKMISRFIGDKLREYTEYIDGNKYKSIYSKTGELLKR